MSSISHMHQCYTTTICIEFITHPCLVSYQCELPLLIWIMHLLTPYYSTDQFEIPKSSRKHLLIWIMHLLTPYYSTDQFEIPKSSRKHLTHSHMDYTSLFFFFFFFSFFFLKTYGLYHNINIKLIINNKKFVVLMVRIKLFFLLLMTIFL